MASTKTKLETLTSRYLHFLDSEELADITFVVGRDKVPIKAHKLILIFGSAYFQEELTKDINYGPDGEPVAQPANVIVIDDLNPVDFQLFLKFLYTGINPTSVKDALPLLNCATKFNVPSLAKAAGDLLKTTTTLTVSTALTVFQQALHYKHEDLQKSALDVILKNGSQIIKREEFKVLTTEALTLIIKEDKLRVLNEMELFESILVWGKEECIRQKMDYKNPKYLRSAMESVLKYIRFPQMVASQFSLKVAKTKILTSDEIVDILPYFHVSPTERADLPSEFFISTPRKYFREPKPKPEVHTVKRQTMQNNYMSSPNQTMQHMFTRQEQRYKKQEQTIRFKLSQPAWISSIGICPSSSSAYGSCSQRDMGKFYISVMDEFLERLANKTEQNFYMTCSSGGNVPHIKLDQPLRVLKDKWYIATVQAGSYQHCYDNTQNLFQNGKVTFGTGGNAVTVEFRQDEANVKQIPELGFQLDEE